MSPRASRAPALLYGKGVQGEVFEDILQELYPLLLFHWEPEQGLVRAFARSEFAVPELRKMSGQVENGDRTSFWERLLVG